MSKPKSIGKRLAETAKAGPRRNRAVKAPAQKAQYFVMCVSWHEPSGPLSRKEAVALAKHMAARGKDAIAIRRVRGENGYEIHPLFEAKAVKPFENIGTDKIPAALKGLAVNQ